MILEVAGEIFRMKTPSSGSEVPAEYNFGVEFFRMKAFEKLCKRNTMPLPAKYADYKKSI